MVALGMRGQPGERTGEGHCCSLGRETFLVPVTWDKPGAKLEGAEGWPVVNPGVGRILAEERAPALPPWTPPSEPSCDHFDRKVLGPAWSFVRTPREPLHSLEARPGFLRLTLARYDLDGAVAPAFVGRRVQHGSYSVRARLEFRPRGEREVAGLLVRNGRHHLRLVRARGAKGDVVQLVRHTTEDQLLAEAPAPAGALHLKIEARGETDYTFWFAAEPEAWVPLGGRVDGRLLGHKAPGALFTGSLVGMYASAEGHASHTKADFDYFEYRSE
jgi:alpha-N-arabinofuranosidase